MKGWKLPSFAELMGPYLQNGFELVTQALFHLARDLSGGLPLG